MYELLGYEGLGTAWLLIVSADDEVREIPYSEDVPLGWELAGLVFRGGESEPLDEA